MIVLDEVYKILSKLPGYKGVRIIEPLPHGRLSDVYSPAINPFLPLNISRVYGIDDTIIIILELEPPILLHDIGFALFIIFLDGGDLSIFINVDM